MFKITRRRLFAYMRVLILHLLLSGTYYQFDQTEKLHTKIHDFFMDLTSTTRIFKRLEYLQLSIINRVEDLISSYVVINKNVYSPDEKLLPKQIKYKLYHSTNNYSSDPTIFELKINLLI